ncbi:MAG: hypothetical protein NTZ46_06450 [Verrucomicrobia bacterium]|nr:hypothetical protein [Verrucomicrobiota bacterium]
MIPFFERQRLVKKGLASPKQRRRRSSSEIAHHLESGFPAKLLIFAAFSLGIGVLIFAGDETQGMEKFLPSRAIPACSSYSAFALPTSVLSKAFSRSPGAAPLTAITARC